MPDQTSFKPGCRIVLDSVKWKFGAADEDLCAISWMLDLAQVSLPVHIQGALLDLQERLDAVANLLDCDE